MLDVEGLQGPSDTFIFNSIDDPMHDAHVEPRLRQGFDTQHVQQQVLDFNGATNQAPGRGGGGWRLLLQLLEMTRTR